MARIIRRKHVEPVSAKGRGYYVVSDGRGLIENVFYFNVARRGDGWYVSAEGHAYGAGGGPDRPINTDGPYKTEERAVMVGKNAAVDWFDVKPEDLSWDTELLRRFPEGISGGLGALFGRR